MIALLLVVVYVAVKELFPVVVSYTVAFIPTITTACVMLFGISILISSVIPHTHGQRHTRHSILDLVIDGFTGIIRLIISYIRWSRTISGSFYKWFRSHPATIFPEWARGPVSSLATIVFFL